MTFDPISYVYVPTASRSKGSKSENKTTKHGTASKKSQKIQSGATILDTSGPPVSEDVDTDRERESRIFAETTPANDVENGNDVDSWPDHLRLLYTAQQQRRLGHFGRAESPDSATCAGSGEMEEDVPDEEDDPFYNGTSMPGDSLGSTPDDPIVLRDTSIIPEVVEFDFEQGSVVAASRDADASLFSSANAPDSGSLASSCNTGGPCQNPDNSGSTEGVGSGAIAPSSPLVSMPAPHRISRSSSESLPSQSITSEYPDHSDPDSTSSDPARACSLPTPRLSGSLGLPVETGLLGLVPDSDGLTFGEETQQPRDTEGDEKVGGSGNSEQHQDDIPSSLARLGGPGNATSIIEEKATQSANRYASPHPSPSNAGSRIHSDSSPPAVIDRDSALPCEGDRRPYNPKRKGPPSRCDDRTQKKRKYQLRRSTRHQRTGPSHEDEDHPTSKTDRHSKGQLPSPTPSASHGLDTEMTPCGSGLGGPSRDSLPSLTEITFRPQSMHACSFTAVVQGRCDGRGVSLNQLVQLIEGMGYVGNLVDLTIKPLQQDALLFSDVRQPISSQFSSGRTSLPRHTGVHTPRNNAVQVQLRQRQASRALSSRGSVSATSDDDLSDSDPDIDSDDDGSCIEAEQHRSTTKKMIPWDEIDENRLRVWKEEGKPWKWIFQKFPSRTEPAIRTRWTMIQQRVK